MKREEIRQMILAALLVALGVILARLVHLTMGGQWGGILLPMHITVLLCGFLCGFKYGMLCGFLTPLIAMLVSGVPNGITLVAMEFELAAYGFCAGLFSSPSFSFLAKPFSKLFQKHQYLVQIIIALIISMLVGRIVWGTVRAITMTRTDSAFTWELFLTGGFVTALPGIIAQIILIPTVVMLCKRSKLSIFN